LSSALQGDPGEQHRLVAAVLLSLGTAGLILSIFLLTAPLELPFLESRTLAATSALLVAVGWWQRASGKKLSTEELREASQRR